MIRGKIFLPFLMVIFCDILIAGPAFTEKNVFSGADSSSGFGDGLGGILSALIVLALTAYIGLGIGGVVQNILESKRPCGTGNDFIIALAVFISWGFLPVLIIMFWKKIILIILLVILAIVIWALRKKPEGETIIQPTNVNLSRDFEQAPSTEKERASPNFRGRHESQSSTQENFSQRKYPQETYPVHALPTPIREVSHRAIHGRANFEVRESAEQSPNSGVKITPENSKPSPNPVVKPKNPADQSTVVADDPRWWFDSKNGSIMDSHTSRIYSRWQVQEFENGFLLDATTWARKKDVIRL